MTRPDETGAETLGQTSNWMEAVPTRDLTGATLGDFQVERPLGRGGMGEVYLATQISLNRPVALKVLRPDLLTKPTYLSRFEAEATAVAKLNHPNIVHVYMLGAVGGVRFIAMEYVQGSNLRDYIRKKGAVDFPLALSIMRQAGQAVGAAGEVGLVHRDIKPENLLLTRKGQVKVTDFGLCRDIDSGRVNLTQTGITMGTPLYMSPEQAQGHDLDHRSDLYSLGVTFYHMLAGVPPFKADSPLALALKHVKDTPPSIAVHRPDVPPDLDRLVLKLMAKSPADRYQSAAEMLRDLARVREALHAPSTVQPVADVPGSSPALETAAPAAPAAPSTAGAAGSRAKTLQTRFLAADPTAPPWIGRRAGAALVALGLVAGAAIGWANRPADLLSPAAAAAPTMPGLWMDPRWKSVDRGLSAEDQYLYAQVRAPKESLEAAWLAVPGHFPNSREWAARAYTQLARLLLVRHDADRLRALAAEVERWEGGQTHEKELAAIIRAGARALDGDLDGVLADFKERVRPTDLTDPALLALGLEVTGQAERVASAAGAATNNRLALGNLHVIRQQIVAKLFQTGFRDQLLARLRAG